MKRKYLYRLIMIMISLLFVPIMIISILFWRNSLKELQTANDAYQEKILSAYVSVLDEIVLDFRERAAFVSANSKESSSQMFDGVSGLEENYFRYYQIANELSDMNPYMGAGETSWGIYLYDVGKIIKPGNTTNIENFIYEIEKNGYDSEEVYEFFSADNYKWSNDVFCSTRNEETGIGNIIIGVYTHIGTYQDKALVYFEVSPRDMEEAMTILDEEKIGFSLFDENKQEVLLSWGDDMNAPNASVYKKETTMPGVYIIARVSEDSIQQNLYEYAINTGKLMVLIGVLLLVCCLCAVYATYKPIRQLTSGIEIETEDKKESEIDVIKNAMERDRSIIEKQESTIQDLLLSHLLYGGHISLEAIKRLGVEQDMKYYSIFLLCGNTLDAEMANKMASIATEHFDTRLFVINLEEQNKSAFVLFSKTEEVLGLFESVRQWLSENSIDEKYFYVGRVVDKLDDIQMSFKSALSKEKKALEAESKHMQEAPANTKAEKQKKLVDDILAYLELHFKDASLGQVQVADAFEISNYTLSRMFKSQVGIGFAEYLIEKRLDYAKHLLLESDYSIQDIALMSGFSSVHYFSRMFKAALDVTPSAFRKEKGQFSQS